MMNIIIMTTIIHKKKHIKNKITNGLVFGIEK